MNLIEPAHLQGVINGFSSSSSSSRQILQALPDSTANVLPLSLSPPFSAPLSLFDPAPLLKCLIIKRNKSLLNERQHWWISMLPDHNAIVTNAETLLLLVKSRHINILTVLSHIAMLVLVLYISHAESHWLNVNRIVPV